MFSDFQQWVSQSWKQRKKALEPKTIRKQKLCVRCGTQGYRVKLDYLKNVHTKHQYTTYDVTLRQCPRCNHLDKEFMRIEGKGKLSPVNAGKVYGGN